MTWTVLYTDSNDNLLYKTVDAPHGAAEAWKFIVDKYAWPVIAIISGMHDVYHPVNDE